MDVGDESCIFCASDNWIASSRVRHRTVEYPGSDWRNSKRSSTDTVHWARTTVPRLYQYSIFCFYNEFWAATTGRPTAYAHGNFPFTPLASFVYDTTRLCRTSATTKQLQFGLYERCAWPWLPGAIYQWRRPQYKRSTRIVDGIAGAFPQLALNDDMYQSASLRFSVLRSQGL